MDDRLRASDQDRENVAATLREQYAQGRLTMEEFDERSSAAYAARTLGELRALTADLPAEPPARPARGAWSPRMAGWLAVAAGLLVVALVATVVTHGHVFFIWPPWLFAVLVLRAVRGRRGHWCGGPRMTNGRGFPPGGDNSWPR